MQNSRGGFYTEPHPYGAEGYMIISDKGMAEMQQRMADKTLGLQAVRVLFAMMDACEQRNRCMIGQKQLVDDLGMRQSAVSRALGELLACGFLERPTSIRGFYAVSPHFAWRGTTKALIEEMKRRAA